MKVLALALDESVTVSDFEIVFLEDGSVITGSKFFYTSDIERVIEDDSDWDDASEMVGLDSVNDELVLQSGVDSGYRISNALDLSDLDFYSKKLMVWDGSDLGGGLSINYSLHKVFNDGSDTIHAIKFSPDGTLLAATSLDNNVYVYDAIKNSLIQTISDFNIEVYGVGFSPDGALLAIGGRDNNVRVYLTSDYSLVEKLSDAADSVFSVDFSPDGALLAVGSADNNVYVYNTSDYSLVQTLTDATNFVNIVDFSPNGALLAAGSEDNNVYVYNTSDYSLVQTLTDATDAIFSMDFSPDNDRLAAGSADNNARVYSTNNWALLHVLNDANDWILDVRFDSKGKKLISSSVDTNVRSYETNDFTLIDTFELTDVVFDLGFNDLKIGMGDFFGNVAIYSIEEAFSVSNVKFYELFKAIPEPTKDNFEQDNDGWSNGSRQTSWSSDGTFSWRVFAVGGFTQSTSTSQKQIDLTNVDTIIFDVLITQNNSFVRFTAEGTTLKNFSNGTEGVFLDNVVDVSSFTGITNLGLAVQSNFGSGNNGEAFFDNIRYIKVATPPSRNDSGWREVGNKDIVPNSAGNNYVKNKVYFTKIEMRRNGF